MKDFISKPRIIQNKEVRKKMQEKIGRIKFEGSSCLPEGIDTIKPLFMKRRYIHSKKKKLLDIVEERWMAEELVSINWLETISHELAHSIDPCAIQFDFKSNSAPIINYEGSDNPEKTYPFPIIECLRSEDSIKAFRPDYSSYPFLDLFCHRKDQIMESFCDWLATEILFRHMNSNSKLSGNNKNQHINGIASIYRPDCNPKDGLGPSRLGQETLSRHPMSIDRLERITFAHPGIRRKLCGKNVKSKVKYCDPTINRNGDSGEDKSSSSTQ